MILRAAGDGMRTRTGPAEGMHAAYGLENTYRS